MEFRACLKIQNRFFEVMKMLMTFDFIALAQHNVQFMARLKDAVSNHSDDEIIMKPYKLTFHAHKQIVTLRPYPETSEFYHKIVPKEITYQALMKMLNNDWENIGEDDIKDIEPFVPF